MKILLSLGGYVQKEKNVGNRCSIQGHRFTTAQTIIVIPVRSHVLLSPLIPHGMRDFSPLMSFCDIRFKRLTYNI